MNFSNPIMLAGLGAVLIPLVLHFLSKSRYRTVNWGAVMFLQGDAPSQRQSTKLKQALLLALRMLLIAILALALARPSVRAGREDPFSAGKKTAAIIVDCSGSMAFDENGRTRLDLAREAIFQILAGFSKGDQISLITTGQLHSPGDTTPTGDLQAIATRVSDLTASQASADIASALNSASGVFQTTEAYINPVHELYIVTDRQARTWLNLKPEFAQKWNQGNRSAPTPMRIVIIPVGSTSRENVAIESIAPMRTPAIKNIPCEFEVKLHNFGAINRDGVTVSLQNGSQETATTTLNIPAGQTQSAGLVATFTQSGSTLLTASINGVGLPIEDHLLYALNVSDPIKVLIVSGEEQSRTLGSESLFLNLALTPFRAAESNKNNPAAVTVVTSDQFNEPDLSKYQVVVLANVGQLTSAQVQAIEQFVYSGGGLWLAPGNLVRAQDYNQWLYRNGSGVLPAALSPPTPADESGATSVLGIDLSHPLFTFLRGRPDPIPLATIKRYFPAVPSSANSRVLASYVSGRPFLIEGSFGRGHTLLMTTSLDASWGNLPVSRFYLPFAQSTVLYLASAAMSNPNVKIGQPLVANFDSPVDEHSLRLTLPDSTPRSSDLIVNKIANRTEVRYEKTTQPGAYVLKAQTPAGIVVTNFVVQAPPGEADLTPLTIDQWRTIQQSLGAELIELSAGALRLQPKQIWIDLWPVLLGCVFGLAVIELLLEHVWLPRKSVEKHMQIAGISSAA